MNLQLAIVEQAGIDGVTVYPITTDQYRLPAAPTEVFRARSPSYSITRID